MSLINIYQCKDCKTVFVFKFDSEFEEDGFCPNCKSDNFDIVVEAVTLDSRAIEKRYTESISKGESNGN